MATWARYRLTSVSSGTSDPDRLPTISANPRRVTAGGFLCDVFKTLEVPLRFQDGRRAPAAHWDARATSRSVARRPCAVPRSCSGYGKRSLDFPSAHHALPQIADCQGPLKDRCQRSKHRSPGSACGLRWSGKAFELPVFALRRLKNLTCNSTNTNSIKKVSPISALSIDL
jgi:hypothetical protein